MCVCVCVCVRVSVWSITGTLQVMAVRCQRVRHTTSTVRSVACPLRGISAFIAPSPCIRCFDMALAATDPARAWPAFACVSVQGHECVLLCLSSRKSVFGCVCRYESVFDVNVARELFTRICGHKCSPQQVETMAHEWAASHKPRLSQVSDTKLVLCPECQVRCRCSWLVWACLASRDSVACQGYMPHSIPSVSVKAMCVCVSMCSWHAFCVYVCVCVCVCAGASKCHTRGHVSTCCYAQPRLTSMHVHTHTLTHTHTHTHALVLTSYVCARACMCVCVCIQVRWSVG